MDNSTWALGPQSPAWPVDACGRKQPAALLCSVPDSDSQAEVILSLLASCGIPCFKYYEPIGAADKVILGASPFGAGLYVPQPLLEEAQAILAAPIDESELI